MSPLETFELVDRNERDNGVLLEKALSLPRYYNCVDLAVLRHADAFHLPAMNATARINWTRSWFCGFSSYFKLGMEDEGPDAPMFLVMIADKANLTSAECQSVDLKAIRRKLGGALQGLTCVGMIEPEYYNATYDEQGQKRKDVVSWHGRYLVWDIDRKGLDQWKRKVQRRTKNRCAIHIDKVTPERFGHIVWYINKSPRTEYSMGRRWATDARGRPLYKAKSRRLRPGHHVQLFNALRDVTLPELSMAFGDARALLRRIKYVAQMAGGRKYRR
jgi:hypothetical protein